MILVPVPSEKNRNEQRRPGCVQVLGLFADPSGGRGELCGTMVRVLTAASCLCGATLEPPQPPSTTTSAATQIARTTLFIFGS
jgi:hypothetical protein